MDTQTELKLSKGRQKRNLDRLLRKNDEAINYGDQVYLHVERKDGKDSIKNLSPIVDGPYFVT